VKFIGVVFQQNVTDCVYIMLVRGKELFFVLTMCLMNRKQFGQVL